MASKSFVTLNPSFSYVTNVISERVWVTARSPAGGGLCVFRQTLNLKKWPMNTSTKYIFAILIAAALVGGSYYYSSYQQEEEEKTATEKAQMENYVKAVGAADKYVKDQLQKCLSEQEAKRQALYKSGSEAKTLAEQKVLIDLAETRYSEDKDTCFRLYGED